MQLRLDCADRLVELVEDRRGPVRADEAARAVLRLGAPVSVALGHSLLDEAVAADARLHWAGDLVALTHALGEELLRATQQMRQREREVHHQAVHAAHSPIWGGAAHR